MEQVFTMSCLRMKDASAISVMSATVVLRCQSVISCELSAQTATACSAAFVKL